MKKSCISNESARNARKCKFAQFMFLTQIKIYIIKGDCQEQSTLAKSKIGLTWWMWQQQKLNMEQKWLKLTEQVPYV